MPALALALDLPQGCLPFGAMMVGYPKAKHYRLPERNAPEILWRGARGA